MLTRPLAPFRIRPLRAHCVRKTVSAEMIRALAAEEAASVKASRRPLKTSRPADTGRLRVIGRTAENEA